MHENIHNIEGYRDNIISEINRALHNYKYKEIPY
jgi:hypothetical protein